eukprot:gb/GEZN01008600.1/.p1 GENE.gb/GEZN01008600.1/~~gb/GEZN01008600.1/.p1  ORF type:complete len:388 (+),score=50.58 gb/GEZN01008600.1/:109-1272(+)
MEVEDQDVDAPTPKRGKAEKGEGKSSTSSSLTSNADENLPWVEKYRPHDLTELISHTTIITTITKLIESNRLPHLLFYGPPGTGKTSTILACARKINGPKFANMILELNASDARGIEVVRNEIKDFASSRMLFSSGIKLVILDEADSMTNTAQFALRRVMEKYTKTTRFCLICNYINKIIPALQSRCTRFRFGPLASEAVVGRLKHIANIENVQMDDGGLEAILELSGGDMRKCLNILQSCHAAYPEVTEEAVYMCTGKPLPSDILSVMKTLHEDTFQNAVKSISMLQKEKGLAISDITQRVHECVLRTSYPPQALMYILDKLADIEHRLSVGASESLQLAALVGIFLTGRSLLAAHAKAEDSQQQASDSSQPNQASQSSQSSQLAT